MISDETFPKIVTLTGSIHLEFRACGRANCHCRLGLRHGPYYVRRWREGGRQRKEYVHQVDVVATLMAIEAHRSAFPHTSRIIRMIRSERTTPGHRNADDGSGDVSANRKG